MAVKIINLSDQRNIFDKAGVNSFIDQRVKAGPKKTRIVIEDADTGEILQERSNKVVITGSVLSAAKDFGINPPVILPSYNSEMELENSHNDTDDVLNPPIICLFCVGDDGCGDKVTDVYPVGYTDRINPFDSVNGGIMPFRYVPVDHDLNPDLRKYYFGRKTFEDVDRVAYYFKTLDVQPQMFMKYTDGTNIVEEMYNIETEQTAEVYVQTKLRINRNDFRDYFEEVRGWNKARVSTLSLCYAWYDDTIDDYKWYQGIYPYTKLNFSVEWLQDLTRALLIRYQVFY